VSMKDELSNDDVPGPFERQTRTVAETAGQAGRDR
jgi:hypothetical protein